MTASLLCTLWIFTGRKCCFLSKIIPWNKQSCINSHQVFYTCIFRVKSLPHWLINPDLQFPVPPFIAKNCFSNKSGLPSKYLLPKLLFLCFCPHLPVSPLVSAPNKVQEYPTLFIKKPTLFLTIYFLLLNYKHVVEVCHNLLKIHWYYFS